MPGLSAVVYRAAHRLKKSKGAPAISLSVAPEVTGRPELRAEVTGDSFYQVSFYARSGGGSWKALGTDDNAPYRVFPDVSGYAAGTALELLAVVKDNNGHVAQASADTTVVAAPPGAAGVATLHYHRADGVYTDWGLHLWGDAIAEGVGTDWGSPRPPTRFDAFGAVFEIPLADPTASLNYIIHKPPATRSRLNREPGGDRSFIPALSPEVWVNAGDPTIHTSEP